MLVELIRTIINSSFDQPISPQILKLTMIIPCIKKASLNPNELSNYRPIANLSFLSKILEKATSMHLEDYLSRNNLYPLMQSGRQFHSTETALIKLFDDVGCALDDGHSAILILLDLFSAFDMVDHEILLKRLETRFSFTGNVLIWLRSYLIHRQWVVNISGFHSDTLTTRWGVPQGSVLGPLFFNLYISPIEA